MAASLIALGYLIGSVPFAFLFVRRYAGIDVRFAGSGNVGASNVFRTSGRSVGLLVAALDVAKGSAVVMCAQGLGADERVRTAAGVAAVVGHIYPVWLGFKGGKGVATACGVFAILAPVATALAALAFAGTVWFTRYVSLGSIVATLLLGPLAYLTAARETIVIGIVLTSALVLFRHRSNWKRLQAGTERRVGRGS